MGKHYSFRMIPGEWFFVLRSQQFTIYTTITTIQPSDSNFFSTALKFWIRHISSLICINYFRGLPPDDRAAVEESYLSGKIHILCSTSTLAHGVNLPAHLVIIKVRWN